MQARSGMNEEMSNMRHELTLMSARVEEDLGKALAIMRTGDEGLAIEVMESEKIVDALQLKIEDMALLLIARQQPVARDLRELVTVFKITSNLERIGDHSIHLAKAAKKLADKPPFRSMDRVERMVEIEQKMLKAAFSAYLARNTSAAREAAAMDDEIDNEHKLLTEEMLSLMKEQPKLVKAAARLLRLSGYLERLGDHITNICEGVIYMVDNKHVDLNH